jgi:parallel beta-helix repeat protein
VGRARVAAAAVVVVLLAGLGGWWLGRSAGPDGRVPPGVVLLPLGADLAEVMADRPPGTTYLLESGVHRGQVLTPRGGDVITGQPGAVLSGAIPLDPAAFEEQDGRWVLGGRTEEPEVRGETDEGFERDAYNHDLWAGPVRLQHVASREAVDGPGEWHFDYAADELVVGADPVDGPPLELAVTETAIGSTAADVVLADLTVTRYASPSQVGAIDVEGPGWRMERLVVTGNHGVGVHVGERSVLVDSTVTHNGQVGVAGTEAHGMRVERTEIAANATLRYEWFWEGGGTKFTFSDDAVVRDCWVHDNGGPGIWFDLENRDLVIEGNLAEDNEVMGIFAEVSWGALVTGNTVRGNGFGERAGRLGAGISISGVSDAQVTGNVLTGNAVELSAIHYARTSETTGEPFTIEGLSVTGNHVTAATEGAVAFYVDTGEDELYTDGSVTFDANTYRLDGCEPCFRWGDLVDAAGWRAVGNDGSGVFTEVDR